MHYILEISISLMLNVKQGSCAYQLLSLLARQGNQVQVFGQRGGRSNYQTTCWLHFCRSAWKKEAELNSEAYEFLGS